MPTAPARSLLAVVALAGAVTLSGCSLVSNVLGVGGSDPVRDDTGAITETNDAADVFSITVGDCTNDGSDATSGTVSTVAAVPCADPHDNEVYYAEDLPDPEFPGADAVIDAADTICYDAFAGFVGLDYESSRYGYYALYPTEQSWATGDREVLCLVYDYSGGQLTGSAAGTGE